ncbi:hypothetical protein BAE44_0018897 [Dichanthelium oligosanthes]|uniref:Uncharacterized protein n=1 Tax=Dichanthelium oligosanthes TaxID=888268 RepID=A0A1E5V521_9POAL|nr:hypothetical protein BAE44_0018897 [Dichanthelium oligosanthes]
MNFIVIKIHVLPRQNFGLAIILPNRQRMTSVERLIHSDRYEDPTPLHCQNPCSIFEEGWPLLYLFDGELVNTFKRIYNTTKTTSPNKSNNTAFIHHNRTKLKVHIKKRQTKRVL